MSTVITIEDIHSYTEVNYIISHMNERYIEMIPIQLRKFFQDLSDPDYEVKINPHLPLETQGLQRYTLEIIAIMHLKYWCLNEERKQELYSLMLKNDEDNFAKNFKYRANIESLFNNVNDESVDSAEQVENTKTQNIQKYDNYSKENEDIKDFTDVIKEETEESLPANNITENSSLIQKIKAFILGIFKKSS